MPKVPKVPKAPNVPKAPKVLPNWRAWCCEVYGADWHNHEGKERYEAQAKVYFRNRFPTIKSVPTFARKVNIKSVAARYPFKPRGTRPTVRSVACHLYH